MKLDLSSLTFLDSSGLKAILRSEQICASHGCELTMRPGPAHVQNLFEITGLLEHLPFREDDPGHAG